MYQRDGRSPGLLVIWDKVLRPQYVPNRRALSWTTGNQEQNAEVPLSTEKNDSDLDNW